MTSATEFWNEQAARFDEQPDHGLRDPTVRAAWRDLLASVLPSPPARILDLGCGTGSLSLLLAELGHEVAGLDFAAAMIELARAKAPAVEFVVGDATAPPWRDHSADVVLARHLVWALPDPAAAMARWLRLVRSDGRLVLIEGHWSAGTGLSASELVALLATAAPERSTSVLRLSDPGLWGQPVTDERYLLLSPSSRQLSDHLRQVL